jgi:kinesin family protein 15
MCVLTLSFVIIVLQIITTPTKVYQLCSQQVPKLSPEMGRFGSIHTQNSSRLDNDILNEPVPSEMNEQAFEAISEELRTVQVML